MSVLVSRIELVEPYGRDIWNSFAEQKSRPASVRARILLHGDEYIAVTETVGKDQPPPEPTDGVGQ